MWQMLSKFSFQRIFCCSLYLLMCLLCEHRFVSSLENFKLLFSPALITAPSEETAKENEAVD